MRPLSTITRAFVLASSLALASCATARPQIRPTTPFTPAMARLFDDSVDYVQNVEGLGGRIAREWQSQIDGLVADSDLIATVSIETVVLGTDADGSRSYRLLARVHDDVRGQIPDDERVPLRVAEGQTGFMTVSGKESRLQSSRYLLFVKWYTDATGALRAHWHMSPFSDPLLSHVRQQTGLGGGPRGAEHVVSQQGEATTVVDAGAAGAH
jgi:hypothetical protein